MNAIDVRCDYEGLRIAAGELLEEALIGEHRRAIEQRYKGSQSLERMLEGLPIPDRSLAAAFYDWAAHLFLIDANGGRGIMRELWRTQAIELKGLCAIAVARRGYQEKHPPCPQCGLPALHPESNRCASCGAELKKAA